ncbi:MAG: cytochrome c oxidase subunit II [Chloroflexi bacterium]|nr:cytochrome c oxidase subunit II [Chloroflexota bacterium]
MPDMVTMKDRGVLGSVFINSSQTQKILLLLMSLALAVLATGCFIIDPNANQSTFEPLGPVADRQLTIFWWILIGGGVVFVLVEAALIYALIKFRRRDEDELPKQVHGNKRLEILWTIIPAIVVIGFSIASIDALFYSADVPKDSDKTVTLEAIGHQWWFEFRYPSPNDPENEVITANEVYIPVGIPVRINLESVDVIHSFWVPKLAGKVDMVPSEGNYMWFQADVPGEFFGQCAEYCGTSHANMKFKVVAVSPPEFDKWLSDQIAPAVESGDPLALEGAGVFKSAGCSGCHSLKTVAKSGSKGRVGPNLAHLASRRHLAAGMMDSSDGAGNVNDAYLQENLRKWLENPSEIKPGNIMFSQAAVYTDPDKSLTERQISALVAYLTSLK